MTAEPGVLLEIAQQVAYRSHVSSSVGRGCVTRLEILAEESDGAIVVALIHLPTGTLKVMAEVDVADGCLFLDGLHCHGIGVGANDLGFPALRRILREVLHELELDAAIVSGGVRTTGASPGRLPRPIRIARHGRAHGSPARE